MRHALLLAGLLLFTGCQDITGPTIFVDQEFRLSPGERAHLVNTQTYIAFDGVENDSRCPADVVCIQGGDALVKIRVLDGSVDASYDLHTGDMKPVTHGDLTIALIEVSPYPFSTITIQPDDYRATLKVTRTP
jgi:hypothetical protein